MISGTTSRPSRIFTSSYFSTPTNTMTKPREQPTETVTIGEEHLFMFF